MKKRTLSEHYKSNKIFLHGLLVFAVMLVIIAIVFAVKNPLLWKECLILTVMAFFFIVVYFIALVFTNIYIKKLEKEEAMKDEKIKEIEEALEKAKKDS